MAALSSFTLAGLLISLRDRARQQGLPLADALRAAVSASARSVEGGLVIKASANGHSYEWKVDGAGLNPETLAAGYYALYRLYLVTAAALGPGATDDAIEAQMLASDALTPCNRHRPDFSLPMEAILE